VEVTASSYWVRSQTVLDRLRPLGERWPWFGTALRVQERMSEINGNYLAAAVTLTAFLSLFPLLLVAIAVVGFVSSGDPNLANSVIEDLGLEPGTAAADNIKSAIQAAERSRKTASVVGFVGLLWSGLGLVAALQYVYNTTWQVKGRGLKDKLTGLLWLAGAGVIFAASFGATTVLNFLPGFLAPISILVGLAVNVALFLWAMKVLPNRDVGWKALLPGAVFAAVGFEVLKFVGSIYVPKAVAGSQALYGTLGVVFAVLAWLLFFGRLVVYSSLLNVVRWEEDHGTRTVETEVPKLPHEAPVAANRVGQMEPRPDISVPERLT
jgi:membrane protein